MESPQSNPLIKLKGPRVPRSGGPIITTQGGTPTPGTTTAGNTLGAFQLRVSETYRRLVKAFEDSFDGGDEFADIDLDRELPPGLWLRILGIEDAPLPVAEHRKLRLSWELDEEEELWAVISAGGVEIARREFEPFLDEHRWTRTSLEWLAEKLGVDDPELGRCVRESIPRR